MNGKLNQAITYLNKLIEDGAEFPDAAWKAATRYRVNQAALEQAYDNL